MYRDRRIDIGKARGRLKTGQGLAMDCRIVREGFRDCLWAGGLVMDGHVGQGLTLNWRVVYGLADWSGICIFVMGIWIVPGLASDWRCSPALAD